MEDDIERAPQHESGSVGPMPGGCDENAAARGQAHMAKVVKDSEEKPRKKPKWTILAVVAAAVVAVCAGVYVGYFKPLNEARERFEAAATAVQAKNDQLDAAVEGLNDLATNGGEPLDPATVDAANAAIAEARKAECAVPEEPGSVEKLDAATAKLSEPLDYSAQLESIESARAALEDSIARRKLVEQPTADYVVARLQAVDGTSDVEAAT